jgi:hypothetical protein
LNQSDVPFSLDQRPGEDLKRHYIRRLERLVRLRRDFADDLNSLGLDLIDKAIEATYRDCAENGAGRPAKSLLSRLK